MNYSLEKYKDVLGKTGLSELSTKYEDITRYIKYNVDSIFDSFLEIGANLWNVKKEQIYSVAEYKNIYEYGFNEFELSKTTVKNLINIADRFCITTDDDEKTSYIKEKYKDFSYSQLVELLPVSELDIDNYTPSMSIREIRTNKLKNKLLNDYENAIDIEDNKSLINTIIKYIDNYTDNILDHELTDGYDTRYLRFFLNEVNIYEITFSFSSSYNILSLNYRELLNHYNWGKFTKLNELDDSLENLNKYIKSETNQDKIIDEDVSDEKIIDVNFDYKKTFNKTLSDYVIDEWKIFAKLTKRLMKFFPNYFNDDNYEILNDSIHIDDFGFTLNDLIIVNKKNNNKIILTKMFEIYLVIDGVVELIDFDSYLIDIIKRSDVGPKGENHEM